MARPIISIRMPADLVAALDAEAKRDGRTRSNLVVLYLRRALEAAAEGR